MPEIVLNCQNLQCPKPVVQVKRLIEQSSPQYLKIIVDNESALENVGRFLISRGYAVQHTQNGTLWHISGTRPALDTDDSQSGVAGVSVACAGTEEAFQRTLVLLVSPFLGSGDDFLGAKLMKNFLATLPEMGKALWRLVLLNGGVALAAEGSLVLEDLRRLEEAGVDILVCGTCLEHYGLLSKKEVGQTTNMLDIVSSMQVAEKVLRV